MGDIQYLWKHFKMMKWYCSFMLFFSLISLFNANTIVNPSDNTHIEDELPPRFVSQSQTFRVVIGETLLLPCRVFNLGTYVLIWRRGSSILSAGSLMVVRDRRFRLTNGHDLEVRDIGPQDAGDYVCQIGDRDNRDQIHTVEIMVPPSVRQIPSSGQVTARKGNSVTLECKASGNPVPTVRWSRKDGVVFAGGNRVREGASLHLDKIDRHQAGIYQCVVDNGVGQPILMDFQVHVLYPPEIQVDKSWIHSGEGRNTRLTCTVYGDPQPEVTWHQDSFPLEMTERRIMEARDGKHYLIIRNVQPSDFGNYSCVADNSLGRAKKYMELSGRPSTARFRNGANGAGRDSYNLTLDVNSYIPLEEIRLLYRRMTVVVKHFWNASELPNSKMKIQRFFQANETYHQPGRWHEVVFTPIAITSPDGPRNTISHVIRGLQPDSVYEAIVQARNRYGWNEISDLHQFYTRGNEPELTDMELISRSSAAPKLNDSKDYLKMILLVLFRLNFHFDFIL